MHLKSYSLLAALALGTEAFLVPANTEAFTPKADGAVTQDQSAKIEVSVDCSSCPYALKSQRNGVHEWTNDVASDLKFNIDSDGSTIRLNDVPFYPLAKPGLPPQLHVSQQKKEGEDSTFEGYPDDLRMSYTLEYREKKAEDGNTLLTVTMTIMALDGQDVRIDDVAIKAIKDSSGKLLLHSAVKQPQSPNAPDAKCTNALCRVFSKVIAGINKAKAEAKAKAKVACYNVKCFCAKCWKAATGALKHLHRPAQPPADPASKEQDSPKLPTHHKFRPMFNGRPFHHHHHHHKGFFQRTAHVVWKAVRLAFMPILIGVAFGMAASAIGMLVGQLVVFLWMKYRKSEQVVYIPVDTDVKEPLPAYEDVPTVVVSVEKEGEQVP